MSSLKFKDPSTGNWIEVPVGGWSVPSGGRDDQFLKKTPSGPAWADLPIKVVSSAPTSSDPDGLYFVV